MYLGVGEETGVRWQAEGPPAFWRMSGVRE